MFGGKGQWRNPDDIRALEQAGADRVTLWLPEGLGLEALLREMETIAGDLL